MNIGKLDEARKYLKDALNILSLLIGTDYQQYLTYDTSRIMGMLSLTYILDGKFSKSIQIASLAANLAIQSHNLIGYKYFQFLFIIYNIGEVWNLMAIIASFLASHQTEKAEYTLNFLKKKDLSKLSLRENFMIER